MTTDTDKFLGSSQPDPAPPKPKHLVTRTEFLTAVILLAIAFASIAVAGLRLIDHNAAKSKQRDEQLCALATHVGQSQALTDFEKSLPGCKALPPKSTKPETFPAIIDGKKVTITIPSQH